MTRNEPSCKRWRLSARSKLTKLIRLRNALSLRLNAVAFDDDGESIAAAASAFEAFWTRFWCWITGDWGRFVRAPPSCTRSRPPIVPPGCLGVHLPNLFDARPPPPPPPPDLLDDISDLECTIPSLGPFTTRRATTGGTDRDQHGRPRWRDFASGIEAINRLRAIIEIPDRLK